MAGGLRRVWLAMGDEGRVRVEIETSPALGVVRGQAAHDQPARNFAPGEYLPHPYCVVLAAIGDPDEWRWLTARVSVPIAHIRVEHFFDLSQGSDDRAMVEAIVSEKQTEVPVRWVNEGVTGIASFDATTFKAWTQAFAQTEGITAAQWRESIEVLKWRRSEGWRPGPRPRPYRRRTAEPPPGGSLAFFARRSGVMPKDGRVSVGGVELPEGQRRPDRPAAYWVSDSLVEDLGAIVAALAERFSQTGLWPLLWRGREDPASYLTVRGPIDLIDDVDLATALTERWRTHPFAAEDPAPTWDLHASGPEPDGPHHKPFPEHAFATPARLMLVPCNRPADAITAVGGVASEVDQLSLSALLRSWEQRFGAVVYEVGPGLLRLAVDRAPIDPETALELATEILAVSHDGAELARCTPAQIADDLTHGEHDTASRISRRAWDITV